MDLLQDSLIRIVDTAGASDGVSLPGLYERLATDGVASFPGLRAHQRHPWHALLCQLGAVACLKAGLDAPPREAGAWAAILRALTPGFPDGEPWRLVSPADQPAFLQPPIGPVGALNAVATPDELDMLVTSRNHDLKVARMADAAPDDWLFALVALQTSEGFLGAGNFGVSRMNGGFANRPGVGLAPPGGIGAHIFRDIHRLIKAFDDVLERFGEYEPEGPALLWLQPWNGETSMPRKGLHPWYIEICRRVRLVSDGDRLSARVGNSKAMRVFMDKAEAGITGDPWTPVVADERGRRALTVDARGFDYRRLSAILFQSGIEPALLQRFGEGEAGPGWSLLCRATARGQGKTEGHHERRVPIPSKAAARMKAGELPALAELAQARIREAGFVRSALRFGLMTLFQNGPDRDGFDPRDPSSARRAESFLDRFQAEIDRDFFEALFREVEEASADARRTARIAWLEDLYRRGRDTVLRGAASSTPRSTMRSHRALVRAEENYRRAFYGAKDLDLYFRKVSDAA
ncbi:hypothetical protein [Aurantimonas sp. Leaf443]|uniref:hypothetical protein n=1 Tax=Aurantimonas sp. Leaf443 TaxID=1736378 RepID=UPI000700914E|nr:hypothetical protein [Aurantimonas sp. Leaf443]KQT88480.1 hypothetical protein ASG48_03470 [Aurantimonas sp. Leaf443]